jgi:hypothetical protein
VVDDSVHRREIREEGNDLHRAPAFRAKKRVDFVDLADHLGPALGRDAPELVLNNPERKSRKARLLDLPPMGIAVETVLC